LGLYFAHDVCWEAGLVECLDWSGNIATLNSDIVFSSELQDIGLGTIRDERVFLVEGLLEFRKVAQICRQLVFLF
jgi:hypothetical protein